MTEFDFGLIAAAWLTGLAGGSGHCIGMCGGIAAALGAAQPAGARGIVMLLCTHAGRVSGYSAAGAIAGALGSGIAVGLAGDQGLELLRYVAAALIAAIGLRLLFGAGTLSKAAGLRNGGLLRPIERGGAALWRRIAPLLRGVVPAHTPVRAFGAGLLWGWLPCGLVYAQLSVAAAAGSAVNGAAVMAAFGLGTLISLSVLGTVLHAAGLARLPNRASGALLVLFAAWTAFPIMFGTAQPMH